jgi:hypothetical protein
MRTAEEIRAQQLLYGQSSLTSAVSGLPPSYVEGFKHTLDKYFRVTIGAGLTTVQGSRVSITEDRLLRDADWLCSKTTDSGTFYYVYLTRTGVLHVDRTTPQYSGKYFYYQHPAFGYRSIGKLWCNPSGNIKWCTSRFTAYSNQVVTVQEGYLGYADYYISEDEDASILFQAANDYLSGAFNGGVNTVSRGTYTTENTVTLDYGVTFRGEGEQTLIQINTVGDNGFEFRGAAAFGCSVESCKVVNVETVAQDKYLIDFNGATKGKVYNNILDYVKCAGVNNDGANNSIINNTMSGGKSNEFSVGNTYTFNSATSYFAQSAYLTETKAVIIYSDSGNSNYGTAIIATINGDVISFGSEYVFVSASTLYQITVCSLSETTFMVAYADSSDSYKGKAKIGIVSGTEITFGDPYVFNATTTQYGVVSTKLTGTSFALAYRDYGDSEKGNAIIGVVSSGSVITFGSEYLFKAAITVTPTIQALSETKIIIAYLSTNAYAIVGNITNDDEISFGTEVVFNSGNTYELSIAKATETRAIIVYKDVGNSNYGTAIIADIDNTTITYGIEQVFNSASSEYMNCISVSENSCIIFYRDNGNGGAATIIAGFIYDDKILWSSPEAYGSATAYFGGYYIGENKIFIAWSKYANILTFEISNVIAVSSSGRNAIIQANHIIADDTEIQEVGIYVSGDENLVVNNQIDGLSGSDRNIKVGVLITSDSVRSVLSANKISNNLNYGLVVYGTNTQINNTMCFNNGDDTGIANENEHNYLDEGTGTQL